MSDATLIISHLSTKVVDLKVERANLRDQLKVAVAALEKIAHRGSGPLQHRLECEAALTKINLLAELVKEN